MKRNSIDDVINYAVKADRLTEFRDDTKLLKAFIEAIRLNKDLFLNTNMVDLKSNNGYKIDTNIIDRILNKYEDINSVIESNNTSELSDDLIKSNIYSKLGVVLVLFDGNFYAMLEMMLLSILTHNTMIFMYDGYMLGSNTLLVNITESFFKKQKMDENIFQQIDNIDLNIFKNFKSIDKTILIGDQEFVDKYLKECTTEVVVSRYDHYDLYIEDITHMDLIGQILEFNTNLNVYIKDGIDIDYEDAMIVGDVDEAISNINSNGSKNASSIFTSDDDNAKRFISDCKSKVVYVNANPSYERNLDIKQEDLLREKRIIVPR